MTGATAIPPCGALNSRLSTSIVNPSGLSLINVNSLFASLSIVMALSFLVDGTIEKDLISPLRFTINSLSPSLPAATTSDGVNTSAIYSGLAPSFITCA